MWNTVMASFPVVYITHRVNECRIRQLRVGDVIRSSHTHWNTNAVVVSADNKRIAIVVETEYSKRRPNSYQLHLFERDNMVTDCQIYSSFTFMKPYFYNCTNILHRPDDRRVGRVELVELFKKACNRGEEVVPFRWMRLRRILYHHTKDRILYKILWNLERPARVIQRAWRAWRTHRRKRAVALIEDAVLEAMYRPGNGWRYMAVQRSRW
jgi:hypothetical protein